MNVVRCSSPGIFSNPCDCGRCLLVLHDKRCGCVDPSDWWSHHQHVLLTSLSYLLSLCFRCIYMFSLRVVHHFFTSWRPAPPQQTSPKCPTGISFIGLRDCWRSCWILAWRNRSDRNRWGMMGISWKFVQNHGWFNMLYNLYNYWSG